MKLYLIHTNDEAYWVMSDTLSEAAKLVHNTIKSGRVISATEVKGGATMILKTGKL